MARRGVVLFASVLLILSQAVGAAASGNRSGPAAQQAAAPIAAGLVAELRSGSRSSFVVEFRATTDLRGAGKLADKTAKGTFVHDRLTKTAATSQADAIRATRGLNGIKATTYWLTNVMVVKADTARNHQPDKVLAGQLANLAERLARTPGVSSIRAEAVVPLVEPVKNAAGINALAPEWGVDKIGAPAVWAEGITGAGIVVGTIDTGVEYTHEALVEHYRGNLGGGSFDHNYNWWDPSGICPEAAPCDNVFHGTHTMGTIVGGDLDGPLPDIGVAPGAEWIAAKGCEDLGCSESALLSSGQFMVAPTDLNGENADPLKAPDLVSNSWGNDDPNNPFYLETVQAWRAAGIIPVFAAGNAGPGCGSAGTPGNYVEVISAGATDIDDNIAGFSSRGPSPTDKISPNVSAPGVDVNSSVPGGGYGMASGTSMATPHVAGTIALMMSSKLELVGDFDAVLNALNATAIDRPDDQCGAPDADLDPNFVYGEGRIDAKAAVDLVKSGGTLAGTVTDDATTAPIAGARVTADNGERQFSTTTASDGTYDLFLPAGTYTVSASAFGYATRAVFGTLIETDLTTTENFALVALPRFTVSGTVSSAGSPVANATVTVLGTPLPAATTDALGQYAIELPIGDYTLQATLGGCTESEFADISSVGDDVVQDFALQRKIDAYGHACRPIAFDWVDAEGQTAMYGDDNVGYLRLPFEFSFYGEAYTALYISTNGNVNFLGPNADFVPVGIPNSSEPNAAIYAFWRDLVIDEEASIDTTTVGSGDTAAFVIEYSNVLLLRTDARMTFEMKLWANGNIDFVYGDNHDGPSNGRDALVGIENARGNDALEISFMEPVIQPNSAIRIETLPVAILSGTVTDANDGLGIAGASVSTEPGGRSATTDGEGHYELRLLAGSYDVTASKQNYESVTLSIALSESELATLDFTLAAATAAVAPTSFEETLGLGETVDRTVTLSNDGGSTLTWEAKERDLGVTPPDLPPAVAGVYRTPNWRPPHTPNTATFATQPFAASDLPIIIDDPDDDSFDSNELLDVRGQSGKQITLALDYAATMPIEELGGYIYLDVDQDPATGLPPEAHFGLPTQDIGFDYFVHLFDVPFAGTVPLFDAFGNFILEVPATVDGTTISFAIPLEAFGGDDGNIDVAMVTGFNGPSDWAPDEGHGTVRGFSDASWLSESPESGEVAIGGSQRVTITIGSPTLPPGDYHGQVVFVTNAPKQGEVAVDVVLHVTIPAEFGRVTGTITDAHTGAPVAGATVTLHATWLGVPTDFASTTADDGTWSVIGPEGTWPVDVAADGYVGTSLSATIVRGVTTSGADASIHRAQPHSSLDESPLVFVLTPGKSRTATVILANTGGHADLTFEVFERAGGASVAGHAAPTVSGAAGSSSSAPTGWVGQRVAPRAVGGTSLVLVDVNPWDSDAIQQELSANGVAFDVMGSKEMDTIDFGAYDVIYVANDQPQVLYDAISNNFDRLSAYVAGGGYLWFGAASFGFNDGNLDGFVLPGGLSIHGPAFEDFNDVAAPDHPLMAGMPNPFSGSFVSHTSLADLPPGATVIATGQGSGEPTLVEYDFGAGRVLAVGQPVEFAWLFDQDSKLILTNGIPYTQAFQPFTDIPWLSEEPVTGIVAPDGSVSIDITVDTTGLEPGLYQAGVVVLTNDPDHSRYSIPVTLVVPAYQQGINAGGGAYTNRAGETWAADRAYASGAYGWVGTSSVRSTGSPIAGTDDDALYQNARVGMASYRFDVPDGVYRVDLGFAEVQNRRAADRVFSVSLEGSAVLSNFDILAAAGGQRIALDRSFLVEVTDGVLNIGFIAQRGDAPLINAIFVTELPEGAPGR